VSTHTITVDPAERASIGIAIAGTVLAILVMLMSPAAEEPPVEKLPVDDAPVVALVEEATAPEPPKKPEPPKPPEPKPQPRPQPAVRSPEPAPVPSPQPALEPVKEPLPVAEPVKEVPPPVAKAPAPKTADVENAYVAKLRNYIRSITEYPTSGEARRQRPEGASVVRFILDRGGRVSQVEIERTSGSRILDAKAVAIVREGSYPAMPADAWLGAAEHVFTVTVQFIAP